MIESGMRYVLVANALLFLMAVETDCSAQQIQIRRAPSAGIVTATNQQVQLFRANSERIIAVQEANRIYGEAAQEIIKAASDKVDLDMKTFNAYWDKKKERNRINWEMLEGRLENAKKAMVLENARKYAVWQRTVRGDKNRIRSSIRSGGLLNRVMQQIDSKVGLSSSELVSHHVTANLAPLSDQILRGVNVRVSTLNGPTTFSLTSRLPAILERWPYLFADDRIRYHAYAVNSKAEKLFLSKASTATKYKLEKEALTELEKAANSFYQLYPQEKKRVFTRIDSRRFEAAEDFLSELRRTISNHAEIDERFNISRPSYVDLYEPDERNVATLVHYMMKYGVEFGNSLAGTETAYDELFGEMMKLADALEAAPSEESITEPMINLDLLSIVENEGRPQKDVKGDK